jgi:hypothetical protein
MALAGFVLLAAAYCGLLILLTTLTGQGYLDGAISVALGLYICSHPASNLLDLLFSDGGVIRGSSSEERGIAWYALNLLVMIAGWLVVLLGIIRFVE